MQSSSQRACQPYMNKISMLGCSKLFLCCHIGSGSLPFCVQELDKIDKGKSAWKFLEGKRMIDVSAS